MTKFQNIGHSWNLTQEEMLQIDLFIDILILFLECLQISAVDNRARFEQLVCRPTP